MRKDVLDAVVLDEIFQPIADILAPRISCIKLATFFLDGLILDYFYNMLTDFTTVRLLALFLGFWFYVFMLRNFRAFERSHREGLLNVARFRFEPLRIGCLLVLTFNTLTGFVRPDEDSHFIDSNLIISLLYLFAVYFASCQIDPPKRLKKRVLQTA